MRRVTFVAVSLLAASVLGWSVGLRAAADEAKTARGSVTAIAADSVTVKVGDKDMKFMIDAKTVVVAKGAGTKTRRAKNEPEPKAGIKVSDAISAGQNVQVKYMDMKGSLMATEIMAMSGTAKK